MAYEIVETTARRIDGGVEFLLKTGEHVVTVKVSNEALTDLENGPKAHANYTEIFEHLGMRSRASRVESSTLSCSRRTVRSC